MRATHFALALAAIVLGAFAPSVPAEELLRGEVAGDNGPMAFLVTGEDRDNIVGGVLRLGTDDFVIAKQSRLGLIGAARYSQGGEREYGEYAVLSSSFSEVTAVGQPWIPADRYVGCDKDYNTFVAIYRVYGTEAVNALGRTPYSVFTEDASAADESVVYCLYSSPPKATS
jgi:hypothetical protein